jgi:hypothetical protein
VAENATFHPQINWSSAVLAPRNTTEMCYNDPEAKWRKLQMKYPELADQIEFKRKAKVRMRN